MESKQILWTTILGTVVCLAIAVLFFGTNINDLQQPTVYFLLLGFAGSLSLALFRQKKVRDVIYINILIYVLFAIVASFLRPITALILLIYYAALIGAIYFFSKSFDAKLPQSIFIRPLLLAGLIGLLFIIANFIHGLMFIDRFHIGFLLRNMPIGFLVGLGVGIGSEIANKVVR